MNEVLSGTRQDNLVIEFFQGLGILTLN